MNNYFRSLQQVDIFQGYAPENVFILSDLHLFHTNVIKYVERPFEFSALGCKEMNEYLLSQFETLPENCLVWNLGDVLLNRHVSEGEAMSTILRMKKNRKLNLILGNHDFQCDKGQHKNYIEYFTSLGFDEVYNKPIIFDDKYILSHEPVFIPEDRDFINIHGHTHHRFVKEDFFLSEYNKSFPKKKVNPKAYINVCMDANDLKIHCLRDLIDLG
jgi:calcineurin-like phosphoesterase family protein